MENEKVNILLVDARDESLAALEAILRRADYNLVCARSGREGLGHILQTEFAVILLNVHMPDMNGFETASLIKTHEEYRYIPIIFVTGIHNDPQLISKGYHTGAIDYVTEPFDPYVLRSKVAVLVELFLKTNLLSELNKRELDTLNAAKQRLEEEYLKKERKLISVVENSSDFIAIASANMEISYMNEAGRRLVGLTSEMRHKPALCDIFCEKDQGQASEIISKILKDRQAQEAELSLRRFDNSCLVPVWCKFFLACDPEGTIDTVAMVLRDISEKRRTESYLKQTAEKLSKSNAELEQFAWFASHDLKEPMRMVAAYVKLLERKFQGSIDPDTREYIRFVCEGSQRMYALVNDLLVFSGIDKARTAYEWVECGEVLSVVLGTLRILIEEEKARVKATDLPRLKVDRVQIAQVFQNLIGNSIKFRGADTPEIEIKAEEGPGGWMFCVKDNGIGIEPQFGDRIFGVFQRLHTREKYPGTGVGLAICRKIVERHGGKIWVESRPGEGAAFYFTLPHDSVEYAPERFAQMH